MQGSTDSSLVHATAAPGRRRTDRPRATDRALQAVTRPLRAFTNCRDGYDARMRTSWSSFRALGLSFSLLLALPACTNPGADVPDFGDEPTPPDLAMPPSPRPDLATPPSDASDPVDGSVPTDCPAAVGKLGQDLIDALYGCIKGHTVLGYDAGRDAMFLANSDPANNYTVECIYTGRKAPQVKDRASANANKFNTEHTWPQSLGATGAAKSDMHHLFPTDIDANGRRGNYPFGVVKTATWTGPDPDGKGPSKLGTSAEGKTVFEVRDPYKGNIARAIFYFYTRYRNERPADFSTANLQIEEATLRTWHKQDPVDANERALNEAIFMLQKNRNPYIDHPDYVDKVGTFLP